MRNIEDFLDLNEKEIDIRIKRLRESIPTSPGTEYLRAISKKFEVQPWPFISYLAYYDPDLLEKGLDEYKCYDGAENYQAVMEGLRENILYLSLLILLKKRIIPDFKY